MNFSFAQFFRPITKLFHGNAALGVDIGSSSIKVIELSRKGVDFYLSNYAKLETKNYLDHPNQALQASSLRIIEKDVIALMITLLREMKPRARSVILNIPSFVAFTAPVDMPLLSPVETARALPFQARKHIPLPPSELTLDWKKIGEFKNQKGAMMQRIMLISVPKELVARYQNIFKKLPVRLVGIEFESVAATRALGKNERDTRVVIDIGAEYTNVIFTDREGWKYNHQIDYGGLYLTQAIARGLGITASRAESLKRRRGLLGTGGEFELSTLLIPFLDVIIQEVRRAVQKYEALFAAHAAELVLLGGGADLLGIEKYIEKQINLPVAAPQSFAYLKYPPSLDEYKKSLAKEFSIALGLAEKYFL